MTILRLLTVVRHDSNDRAALVTLAGEIDVDSASLVRESLAQCLRDGIRTIDVDVTAVSFCDCSGLNAFLSAFLHTAAAGGSLRLRHPSPALERLVALTGSGSLFHTVPNTLAGRVPAPQPPCGHEEDLLRLAPGPPAFPGGTAVTAQPWPGLRGRMRAYEDHWTTGRAAGVPGDGW